MMPIQLEKNQVNQRLRGELRPDRRSYCMRRVRSTCGLEQSVGGLLPGSEQKRPPAAIAVLWPVSARLASHSPRSTFARFHILSYVCNTAANASLICVTVVGADLAPSLKEAPDW